MSDFAIRTEGLSKQYRIGEKQTSYKTLRDSLSSSLFKGFRSRRANGHHRVGSNGHDSFWALKDISLEVKPGEVVGIIGRNGAGKSTLLKILSRITEPTEGYADIRGRVGSLLEVGTGFHPELTGRENIYLNGAILGMKRTDIARQFDEIVAFAEVEKFVDTPVKHYSSGMYLRLAFAVAAHLEPEILLVDEVLAVGDMRFQKKCLGKMEDVASHGRTVLFVSHNLGAIKELCRTCIVLRDGLIDYHGPVAKGLIRYSQSVMAQDSVATSARSEGWRQVVIDGQTDGVPKPIFNEQPFAVEARLDLHEDFEKVRLFCIVDDSNGNAVIHHFIDYEHSELTGLKAGSYRVRAEFPAMFLMPDAYTLHFKLVGRRVSGESDRHLSERVILDISDLTGQAVGKVRAVIIPPVKWALNPD